MLKKYSLKTRIGIILILVSIVFFLSLPVIPLLDLDGDFKVTLGTVVFILAEVFFYTGGFLVGKELFSKYKKYMNPKNWFKKKTSEEEQEHNS
ncbi:MAG: transporter suffix domain-containing protein [Rhodothermaceae bacterium]